MPGRRKNRAFDEIGYELVKINNKYNAFCTLCKKSLHNTAKSRLRGHRNVCKKINTEVKAAGVEDFQGNQEKSIYFILDEEADQQNDETLRENLVSYTLNAIDMDFSKDGDIVSENLISPQPCSLSSSSSANISSSLRQYSTNFRYPSTSTSTVSSKSTSPSLSLSCSSLSKCRINNKRSLCNNSSSSVSNFIDKLNDKDEEKLNEALSKLIFVCNLPLRLVDSAHFKNFIKKIRPAYADKIPGRKTLSTTLLDDTYNKCISSTKASMSEDSVLLIDGWKNCSSNVKTVVSMLHNANEEQAFLQAWDLSGDSETAEKLSQIVAESVKIEKEIYSTNIYAVVSDNASAMVKMGKL